MGPREKALEERASEKGYARASVFLGEAVVQRARLADALEEALAIWGGHGVRGDVYHRYDRLRAVLKEADRG